MNSEVLIICGLVLFFYILLNSIIKEKNEYKERVAQLEIKVEILEGKNKWLLSL